MNGDTIRAASLLSKPCLPTTPTYKYIPLTRNSPSSVSKTLPRRIRRLTFRSRQDKNNRHSAKIDIPNPSMTMANDAVSPPLVGAAESNFWIEMYSTRDSFLVDESGCDTDWTGDGCCGFAKK